MNMDREAIESYVRVALRANGIEFDDAQLARIVEAFARNWEVAADFLDFSLPDNAEIAPVFRL